MNAGLSAIAPVLQPEGEGGGRGEGESRCTGRCRGGGVAGNDRGEWERQ